MVALTPKLEEPVTPLTPITPSQVPTCDCETDEGLSELNLNTSEIT